MKRLLVGIITLMLPVLLMAQNKSVDRVFDKYAGQDGFTTVYISKYMFSLFQNLEDIEDKEAEEISNVLGDLEGNITYVNKAFYENWGADDPSEIIFILLGLLCPVSLSFS